MTALLFGEYAVESVELFWSSGLINLWFCLFCRHWFALNPLLTNKSYRTSPPTNIVYILRHLLLKTN